MIRAQSLLCVVYPWQPVPCARFPVRSARGARSVRQPVPLASGGLFESVSPLAAGIWRTPRGIPKAAHSRELVERLCTRDLVSWRRASGQMREALPPAAETSRLAWSPPPSLRPAAGLPSPRPSRGHSPPAPSLRAPALACSQLEAEFARRLGENPAAARQEAGCVRAARGRPCGAGRGVPGPEGVRSPPSAALPPGEGDDVRPLRTPVALAAAPAQPRGLEPAGCLASTDWSQPQPLESSLSERGERKESRGPGLVRKSQGKVPQLQPGRRALPSVFPRGCRQRLLKTGPGQWLRVDLALALFPLNV